jgi:hypothetical protein
MWKVYCGLARHFTYLAAIVDDEILDGNELVRFQKKTVILALARKGVPGVK